MREDLDKALCADFPLLYQDRYADKRQTCMAYGFDVGDGWEPLIRRMSEKLEAAIRALPDDAPDDAPENDRENPRALQVKEKFGCLRVYLSSSTDEMEAAIREAEAESARTCETCGTPGKLTGKGWLKTACPEHAK